MARATVLGRVTWRVGTVVSVRDETSTARTIALNVPDWPGHLAGQHVDVRLTAPDGYSAARSYSIASGAGSDTHIELTVERLADGEVSPYLTQVLATGDPLEVRGPIGGWFVWRAERSTPVQLIAGGSGVVPLMAMIRSRAIAKSTAPFRLLYSVREPDAVLYRLELQSVAPSDVAITYAYTRAAPKDWGRPPARVDAELLGTTAFPAADGAECYVCGPTAFVESIAEMLISKGYDPKHIRTERFGATGERK